MPRPGVTTKVVDEVYPAGAILDTGQAFAIGKSARGAVDKPIQIRSLSDYEVKCGDRAGGSLLYDFVNAYFAEGGGALYVGRIIGANSVSGEIAMGTGLKAVASSPGVWSNGYKVGWTEDPTDVTKVYATVTDANDVPLEVSPPVATPEEAIAWGTNRPYVNFAAGAGSGMPLDGEEFTLAGGADGDAPTDQSAIDALNLFPFELGPAQVCAPGITSSSVHNAIGAHCDENYRVGLVDLVDTADPLALKAAVGLLYSDVSKARWLLPLGSWVTYPHPADTATIEIAYSGVQAGLIARLDEFGDPSLAAAGANGISRLALGLTQFYSDPDREELNDAGVAMAKEVYGQVRTYGYRTGAGPDESNWRFFQESRVIMDVAHRCNAAMEEYVFNTIDGRNHLFAKVATMLTGICQEFYLANALYGETAEEAFLVDTGPTVNTEESINRGEVHAVVKVKTSRIAEWIVIDLIKTPLDRSF